MSQLGIRGLDPHFNRFNFFHWKGWGKTFDNGPYTRTPVGSI